MTRLFRLLILVFVFGGVFQVLVHAQEVIWCVSKDEQGTVHLRETGCETGERQISSQTFPSRSTSDSYRLVLVAFIGLTGAVLGAFVTHRLQRERDRSQRRHDRTRDRLQREQDRKIQGIEIFWRYRKEAFDNSILRDIMKKGDFSKDENIKLVLDFYEEVGVYVSRNLIDLHLLDQVMGDYIIDAYESDEVNKWIQGVRKKGRDKTYYEHFTAIGGRLSDDAERRKEDR